MERSRLCIIVYICVSVCVSELFSILKQLSGSPPLSSSLLLPLSPIANTVSYGVVEGKTPCLSLSFCPNKTPCVAVFLCQMLLHLKRSKCRSRCFFFLVGRWEIDFEVDGHHLKMFFVSPGKEKHSRCLTFEIVVGVFFFCIPQIFQVNSGVVADRESQSINKQDATS